MKERVGKAAEDWGHGLSWLLDLRVSSQAHSSLAPLLTLPRPLASSVLALLRPQHTLTLLASELLLLKGCPLPESRGKDTHWSWVLTTGFREQEGSLFSGVQNSQKAKIQRLGGPSTH